MQHKTWQRRGATTMLAVALYGKRAAIGYTKRIKTNYLMAITKWKKYQHKDWNRIPQNMIKIVSIFFHQSLICKISSIDTL
jgi:hypothetical protein